MARPKSIHHTTVSDEVSIDIGSVTANTTLDVTATVTGLRVGRPVIAWTEGALNAGLVIGNYHCSAANTLKFTVQNTTGSAVNPSALNFSVVQF
jgi:hypothetical protein